ncbi:MAG: DUF805 domain-containing protein [Rhodospirillaceae bacterium]|jgi:uncharacterized membrane protein YhaH (DUF805 family)|nr:DUF805 domain-containing protein [Rhodospirillaceae bacterium]
MATINSSQKICIICRKDCSNEPRFKNDQGQYLHESCHNQDIAKGALGSVGSVVTAPSKTVASSSPPRKTKQPRPTRNGSSNYSIGSYFSIAGRSSRKQFWYFNLVGFIPYNVFTFWAMASESIFPALLLLLVTWPFFCMGVRRWHDRDKSGYWTLIILIPLIGGIWQLFELGFLKGTEGSNEYGEDPT